MGINSTTRITAEKVVRYIGYCAALACLALVIFWHPAKAPELDIAQMQVTEGIYDCVWTGGGRSGPSGVDKVDGVSYYGRVGYFFGINPGVCIKELKGRRVRLYYLAPKKTDRKLILELVDLQTGGMWGISREKQFSIYQSDTSITSKWIFYFSKFGLLLLAMRLSCWSWIKNVFKDQFLKVKNHGISR